jgi:hypothetical protein
MSPVHAVHRVGKPTRDLVPIGAKCEI